MPTRIYPDTTLTAFQFGNLLSNIHRTIVQHGRDYVYQDRVTHPVHEPREFVFARVRGYHDRYVPYSRQVGSDVLVGCTCTKPLPCAHLVALWWFWLQQPVAFMRMPYALRHGSGLSWPETAAGNFPWDLVPAEKPFWQKAWDPSALSEWVLLLEQVHSRPWADTALSQALFDLDVSWTESPEWMKSWSSFLADHWPLLTTIPISYWWDLVLANPGVPLSPLWPGYQPIGSDTWLSLLSLTVSTASAAVLPEALSHLIELASEDLIMLLSHLIRVVPSLDPWHLVESRILYHRGLHTQAIKLLAETSLDTQAGRRALRQQLIQWLPEADGLSYRIADCLESDSWECLDALKTALDAKGYASLEVAKRSRMASLGVAPDVEP